MGVPWGVEYGVTKYDSLEFYLNRWKKFCELGLCDHFVFPIDEVLYEFKLGNDGQVSVTTREDAEVIAEMKSLSCGDGTYDEFESVTSSYDLYLPDNRGSRNIDNPEFKWNYQSANSLKLLADLSPKWGRLARELRAAAKFCQKNRMMLGISY
jgi:hypothetical protein